MTKTTSTSTLLLALLFSALILACDTSPTEPDKTDCIGTLPNRSACEIAAAGRSCESFEWESPGSLPRTCILRRCDSCGSFDPTNQ